MKPRGRRPGGRKEPISKFLNKQQRYERKVFYKLDYPNAPYHNAEGKIRSMSRGDLEACLNACHNRDFEPGEIVIQGWEVLTQWDWYDLVSNAHFSLEFCSMVNNEEDSIT